MMDYFGLSDDLIHKAKYLIIIYMIYLLIL
jgi:hypothetical protein